MPCFRLGENRGTQENKDNKFTGWNANIQDDSWEAEEEKRQEQARLEQERIEADRIKQIALEKEKKRKELEKAV